MRALVMMVVVMALAVSPASAQTTQTAGEAERALRMELAERYLQLSQGESLRKALQGYYQDMMAKSEIGAVEKEWVVAQMVGATDELAQTVFTDVRDDLADLYTMAELEALVAFSESPEGRSIANKSIQMAVIVQEATLPRMVAMMDDVRVKYCARFGCETGSASGVHSDKSQR